MALGLRYGALAIVALFAITPTALAQDVTVPLPDEYAARAGGAATEQLPDPTAILQDDGSSVVIPIPGGGEVRVDGPPSETSSRIAPTENWATQRNAPFSVGGAPLGPVPIQR